MSPRRARSALLALALVSPACSLPRSGRPSETREYDILPDAPPAAHGPVPDSTATLGVEPFTASEALEREGLVWRRGEVEAGSYAEHRWARPPQEAMRDVVAAALARALVPLAVATEPRTASPDLVLRAHLARCEEVDRGERWYGVLELRVVLVRRDGREVERRTYSGEELALARHPEAVALALRHVALRLGDEIARDVVAVLARPVPAERP